MASSHTVCIGWRRLSLATAAKTSFGRSKGWYRRSDKRAKFPLTKALTLKKYLFMVRFYKMWPNIYAVWGCSVSAHIKATSSKYVVLTTNVHLPASPSALGLLTYMPRQIKYDTQFMIGESNDTKTSTGIALSHWPLGCYVYWGTNWSCFTHRRHLPLQAGTWGIIYLTGVAICPSSVGRYL